MNYKNTTHIPNVFFDFYMKNLSGSEIKILAIIIRQTFGWILPNGKRKKRDRISYSQFESKTGLSRRVISACINSLIEQKIIRATDYNNNELFSASTRKGKTCIFYTPLLLSNAKNDKSQCTNRPQGVQNSHITKLTTTKLKRQKGKVQGKKRISDWERMQVIMKNRNA